MVESLIAGAVLFLGTVAVLSGIAQGFQWLKRKFGA